MRGGFAELNRSVYAGVDVEVALKEAFSSQFSAAKLLSEGLIDEVRRRPRGHPGGGRPVGIWSACCRRRAEEVQRRRRHDYHHRIEGTLQARFERRRPHAGTLGRGRAVPRHGREARPRAGRLPRHRDPRRHGAGDGGGVYDLGSANAGGTDLVSAPLHDIQRWFDRQGEVTTINVAGADGLAPEELVRRLRAALPAGLEVRTGTEAADQTADEISDEIGKFLTPALLAFAGPPYSSARSSSSTPSRSRSPSARASSRCCAHSGRLAVRFSERWRPRRS